MLRKINILFICLLLCSCAGTVVQTPVHSNVASYDGGIQNSGIIRINDDKTGFIVTPHYRDRYNAMIYIYGTQFKPALIKDEGMKPLSDGTYNIDADHAVKFNRLNAFREMDKDLPDLIQRVLK